MCPGLGFEGLGLRTASGKRSETLNAASQTVTMHERLSARCLQRSPEAASNVKPRVCVDTRSPEHQELQRGQDRKGYPFGFKGDCKAKGTPTLKKGKKGAYSRSQNPRRI